MPFDRSLRAHESMPLPSLPIEIGVRAFHDLLIQGERILLLDCREPDEHQIARIAGSVLMPMHSIPSRLAELGAERSRRIVVHCHHGVRSLRVARFLRGSGFESVQSLAGGIEAWSLEIDPDVPRY